jgi:hypothetical protein
MLGELATIVTPDTILRWHRELVAAKWNYSGRRKQMAQPPTSDEIVELALRMALENPTLSYDRIQGALCNLHHEISDTTVSNIKPRGVEPAPDRRQPSVLHLQRIRVSSPHAIFPPAMLLWLSEKVKFGQSIVLVIVDETRMPLAA